MPKSELGDFLTKGALQPVREVSVSAWVEHAPFAFWLIESLRPKTVVELGTHTGFSFFAMCQAAETSGLDTKLIAVDTWSGDEHAGFYGESVWHSVRSIATRDYAERTELLRMTFDEARPRFAPGSIDLLHVDGRHYYDDAKHDIESWLPALSDRGVVIVHDIAERTGDFGVHLVWDELVKRFDTFSFEHEHGLGLIVVGENAPAVVRRLTQVDQTTADLIRSTYEALGRGVRFGAEITMAEDREADTHREGLSTLTAVDSDTVAKDGASVSSRQGEWRELVTPLDLVRKVARRWTRRNRSAAASAPGQTPIDPPLVEGPQTPEPAHTGLTEPITFQDDQIDLLANGNPFPLIPDDDPLRVLFDPRWYARQRPEVTGTESELFDDWIRVGSFSGIGPHPLFDAEWYLSENPDLPRGQLEAFDAARHFVHHGYREGRSPHPLFDLPYYLEVHPEVGVFGLNPLLHYLEVGDSNGFWPNRFVDPRFYRSRTATGGNSCMHLAEFADRYVSPSELFDSEWYLETYLDARQSSLHPLLVHIRGGHDRPTSPEDPRVLTAVQALDDRWPSLRQLRTFRGQGPGRINLVTDSLSADSLFGGVATAVILAALWSRASGREVRVITRSGTAEPEACRAILALAGIELPGNPEFVRHGAVERDVIDVVEDDLWLTTSWWTSAAVRASVDPERVVYLLQEDERAFYEAGDSSVRAWQEMTREEGFTVVNSRRLLDHLVASGAANLAKSGVSFDASFATFSMIDRVSKGDRRVLAFYSRPNHPRNLWALGLDILRTAFDRGELDPKDWEVHFMGAGTPAISISGVRVINHSTLPWSDYASLLGRVDVGLSLMATPHTSYPPLDMLAAGALVVTNSWPGKDHLDAYGDRLLVAPPNRDALVEALTTAADRVMANERSHETPAVLTRTWSEQLDDVVAQLIRRYGRV